jgi:hypothetical protein
MSTFYVLPPRPTLGQHFGRFLTSMFPGLTWESAVWRDLAEALGAAAQGYPDVFVVYREDLPPEGDTAATLTGSFGAEPGDEVIELQPEGADGAMSARRWRVA